MADSSLPAQSDVEATTDSQRPGHSSRDDNTTASGVLEDSQAVSDGSTMTLALELGRGVGRRSSKFQTMPEETLLEIFSYLSQQGLSAVAPLNHRFFRLSIPLLYRRLVGKFTAPAATRLFVTCVKRRNFPVHTRVLDGLAVAGQMPPEHLNLFAGALINMPNLEVLTLPPHVTARQLIDPGTNLRALRIAGPCIPHAFVARLQSLRALRIGRACVPVATDVLRFGEGPPLEFVQCAEAVAAHLLPPADLESPLRARRVLDSRCFMEISASSGPDARTQQTRTRAFLEALGKTFCPPHTLVLEPTLVPYVARELREDQTLRVVRVCRLVLTVVATTRQERVLCTRYVKDFLRCFVHAETIELIASTSRLSVRKFWSDETVSWAMKARPVPLRLIVYAKNDIFEYQPNAGWMVICPPLLPRPVPQKDHFYHIGAIGDERHV